MEEWRLLKSYYTKLLRDGGANMVSAINMLQVSSMSCIAHSLHLVVAGVLIKKAKRKGQVEVAPIWLMDVESESVVPILEHHEDEQLSTEDCTNMDGLRELAAAEMDEFLDAAIYRIGRDEMDAVREVVQRFRTLATYFRKSPKGQNRLCQCQVSTRHVKPSEALRLQVDCRTRWNSCWAMLQRFIVLEQSMASFFPYLKSSEGKNEFKDMAVEAIRLAHKQVFIGFIGPIFGCY
ncbi:hypothetical protein P3T76_006071 [Phytophthora citrophthora]|uniref:hAT-like transposase RNase-H fold domain-containing protein n=1 Tax=Phytophthora citrophthora TaxID=4793 RepID=A0AAD9GPW6_9STRA|nr:hypothetical protein P3T76_006071 [Phytophthora citrophthora]